MPSDEAMTNRVGDCRSPAVQAELVQDAGDVRLDSVKRVASAVGEGSMAVKFVHEYLAESH